MADNERLTSDKADLLIRLQSCEEDLKTANECENYCTVVEPMLNEGKHKHALYLVYGFQSST